MAEQASSTLRLIDVKSLSQPPYVLAISYPKPDPESVEARLRQMDELGLESITFSGQSNVNGVPILGKGCVGIVVQAHLKDGRSVALKIRRTDANRPNMHVEAVLQRHANLAGVGPDLEGETPDILMMSLVKGDTLPKWLSNEVERASLQRVLRSLLQQCHELDVSGLDHGELSHAHKNVLVAGSKPVIVDFESSSQTRRANNLTSLVQYLIFSGRISAQVRTGIAFDNDVELLARLRQYKATQNRESFQGVLSVLGI